MRLSRKLRQNPILIQMIHLENWQWNLVLFQLHLNLLCLVFFLMNFLMVKARNLTLLWITSILEMAKVKILCHHLSRLLLPEGHRLRLLWPQKWIDQWHPVVGDHWLAKLRIRWRICLHLSLIALMRAACLKTNPFGHQGDGKENFKS